MTEVLKTPPGEGDALVGLDQFYTRIVKSHIAAAEGEVKVVSLSIREVAKRNSITLLKTGEIIKVLGNVHEFGVLGKSSYLSLNQLVGKRFPRASGTKLIPEVGLTDSGFILGTAVEEKSQGLAVFLVRLPFKLIRVPKSYFFKREVST